MTKDKIECKPGEILRKGYNRKGYLREGYKKKDGTIVKTKRIKPTYVEASCIADVGAEGHGKKILPKPEKNLLRPYGYSIHNSRRKREKSLTLSANKNGILKVLRHINLINNYQTKPEIKKRFREDIEFMKKMYDPYRKTKRRDAKQSGGSDDADTESDSLSESESESDKVNILTLPPNDYYLPDTTTDLNQKFGIFVKESHTINGKKIVYTLFAEGDVFTLNMKVDKVKRCQYKFTISKDRIADIFSFSCETGYRGALYAFMEKFCKVNQYKQIYITISKPKSDIELINFWLERGFLMAEETDEIYKMYKNVV